ncbi:MAG: alpha/beta fold hydrolase [Bacillota bacterium]
MPKVNANGAEISYQMIGTGQPLLFIHGSGGCWKQWEPQFAAFSQEFTMILMDMRGHGESSKEFPEGRYSMRVIAEDVKCFLDALGIRQIPIIGLSQGAVVASLFASQHPEYVEKLVLSNGYSEIPTRVAGWVLDVSNAVFGLLSFDTIMRLATSVYGKDEYTKKVIMDSTSIDKQMLLAMKKSDFPEHTKDLHRTTAPTLIMAGDKKIVGPEEKAAMIMLEHIPNAVAAIFHGAFDPLTTMRRDTFNDMVIDFIKGNELKPYDGVKYVRK